MASILKVDEMQGVTSAGDITITSEGGSATQSLQQGVNKLWVNFDTNTTGTPAARDSFNVASFTDNGTGDATISMTNNMSNGNYTIQSAVATYHGQTDYRYPTFIKGDISADSWGAVATGSFGTITHAVQNGGSAYTDPSLVMKSVLGDLA
jgi:hypothetical protein|tara:strand:+ start:340 stop:792 length:453 start_codon:yes stop_codon:yes gene_type:complete